MKKIKLIIKTKSKNYPIIIGSKAINQISNILKSNNISFEKSLIIYDTKVPKTKLNILTKIMLLIERKKYNYCKIIRK